MDDISKKRELVKQAYPHSPTWPAKVKEMRDDQIVAIFFRLRKQRKI